MKSSICLFPVHVRRRVLTAVLVFLGLSCSVSAANTVHDARLDFTLNIPNRFVTQLPISGDMLYAFATSDPAQGVPDLAVSIQELRGTIGPKPLPAPPNSTITTLKWRSYDVQMVSSQTQILGTTFTTRVVQIPLASHALQINVVAPAGKEKLADAATEELVAGLSGSSNFDPMSESEQMREAFLTGASLVIYIVVAFRLVKFKGEPTVAQRRHRRAGRISLIVMPCVLVLVVAGFIISFSRGRGDDNPETYGFVAAMSSMRLSAWSALAAYGIARLIYRVRGITPAWPRRKKKRKSPTQSAQQAAAALPQAAAPETYPCRACGQYFPPDACYGEADGQIICQPCWSAANGQPR